MFFRPGAGVARSWRECCPAPPSPAAGGRERSVRYRHTVRHHRAEAKPGPPHVVRLGTDIFRRRGKCPRRRVRCGGTGRSMWVRNTKEANGPGRGRGFRFGAGMARRCPPPHAVIRTLCPDGQSVRLRRTTRRQRRARHSRQGRAGRAKRAGRAPGGDAVLHRPSGGRKRCGRYRHIVRGPVTRRRLHFLTRSVQYHTVRYFFQERER